MSATGCGGAINVTSGAQLTLNEVRLLNNQSNSDGGALCNQGSAAVAATLFKNNTSLYGHGGAIRSSGQVTIADSRFDGNRAGGGNGGGIDMGGTASVANSAFVGNSAFRRGGGINTYFGTLTLTDSSFGQNSADMYGGALSSDASTTVATNTTFSGNTTPNVGGALESAGQGSLTLVNTTVAGNTAGVQGGNIFAGGTPNPNIVLKNTIVANGTPDNCDFPVASQGNNLESANSCGLTFAGDLVNIDPRLGPLQDNGGPTTTHALLAGSPAIDAGAASGCPAKDQRGVTRPLDGNSDGASVCDIGALELAAPVAPPTVTLSDALDQPQTWLTGAAAPWIAQTSEAHDGVDATQAGAVADRQASWLKTTVRGPGTITFWWKSSSEKGDKLAFYLGRTLKASRSGTGGWQKKSFTIGREIPKY
jgi:predicted outer membrane repeat protein